jgi:hypothetical protein
LGSVRPIGAHGDDGRSAQPGPLDGDGDPRVTPGQLLGENQLGDEVHTAAPVLLRERGGGIEAQLVGLVHDLPGGLLVLVIVGRAGAHLSHRELVGETADLLLLGGQTEVQR